MITPKDIQDKFGRKAIKSRMIDVAARLHGYEHFELDSFDPLVDLMLSALAKELEKSHLFFQDNFNDLCNHITGRLIPEADINFKPSHSVVHCQASSKDTVDAHNFKWICTKEATGGPIELDFVPIIPYTTTDAQVKLIANGNKLVQYEELNKIDLATYKPINCSIYLGVQPPLDTEQSIDISLYFSWFDHPKILEFLNILNHSEWKVNGKRMPVLNRINKDTESVLTSWDKSYFRKTFKEIFDVIEKQYFTISLNTNALSEIGVVPNELLPIIKNNPELAYCNELLWIEVSMPHLEECRALGNNLFCQTNCIPVINLNAQFETHKVRQPYKVVRISGDEYFVDIKRLYDYEDLEYVPRHSLENDPEKIKGTYHIARNSILRIDKRVAIEKIIQLIDLIREERNAFSSFNPDWIVEELEKIKINFQRIEYKLGDNLKIHPQDVFVSLEDDNNESTIRIEYWTCNGEVANGLTRGSIGEVNADVVGMSDEAILLETSVDGKFLTNENDKLSRLKYQLQSRDRIITKSDLNAAIEYKISPLKVKEINYKTKVAPPFGLSVGCRRYNEVTVYIEENSIEDHALAKLQISIENFINERIISDFQYKLQIRKSA